MTVREIKKSDLENIQRGYHALGKDAQDDLAAFCHANKTTVVLGDRDLSYIFEGRRQVYLRIQEFIGLPIEELMEKYTVHKPAE